MTAHDSQPEERIQVDGEYCHWMCDKLISELSCTGGSDLLSLGSGNAVVEHEISRMGCHVLCVDAVREAILLARRKGMTAVRADINVWEPERYWPVIYLGGVLGHLDTEQDGLRPIMTRLFRWLSTGHTGGTVVVSNDSTSDGEPVQAAPGMRGFHRLSVDYLWQEAADAGFPSVVAGEFRCRRPKSGARARSIIVARATVTS